MKCLVLWGARNIFRVMIDEGSDTGNEIECRIKGKVLRGVDYSSNPISPGDVVEVDADGLIRSRLARKNAVHRWNRKHGALQTLAVNVDLIIVVASVGTPPFRPRFIDRAIVAAEYDSIPTGIVVNKIDLVGLPRDVERIHLYRRLGFPVHEISVLNDSGIDSFKESVAGKTLAFIGQSGVGKSSLINALVPNAEAMIGDVSFKYLRGRHTTTMSRLYFASDIDARIIDTPGVRELDLSFIETDQIGFYFPEFAPLSAECAISGCTHDHEPGCAVDAALKRGEIHPDRYESYLRIRRENEYARKERHGT